MKFKKFITCFALFFSLILVNANAKILPPGTGTQADVPSNLLILLDKSGSMGWRMKSSQSMERMHDTITDSSGNIYFAQYSSRGIRKIDYASGNVDTNWGNNGTAGNRGNCQLNYSYQIAEHDGYIYGTSLYRNNVSRIRLSDGKCMKKIDLKGNKWSYPRGAVEHNGHLYIPTRAGLQTINLSTDVVHNCGGGNQWKYSRSMAGSGNYLYAHYRRYMYRGTLTSANSGRNMCPANFKEYRTYSFGWWSYGMAAHPTNPNELYIMGRNNNKLYKATINSNGTGHTVNWTKGRYGWNKVSTASNTYFYYPEGVHYDENNDRLIVAGYYARKIQVFENDGTFIKQYGGATILTRMQAAHKALKAIVNDSNLTSGVNFGFGYWSNYWSARYRPTGFKSWSGDITTGKATPCDTQNCLLVRAHKDGAARINQIISSVNARGGTGAETFAAISKEYYLHGTLSPVDKNSPCQKSYVLIIGDGDWFSGHNEAIATAKELFKKHGIPTFAVAFGTGISSSGYKRFAELAEAGGTKKTIIAKTAESLKTQLQAAISQIIASKLSFTAPVIMPGIDKDGAFFQAQFDYAQNQEWAGTIKKTKIDRKGKLYPNDSSNWNAREKLPSPSSRKIWSAIPNGQSHKTGATKNNNWTTNNSTAINDLITLMGFDIQDYHRKTANLDGTTNNMRCANTAGVADDVDDDLDGLINFVRGTDYFDYDADCNITETRAKPMGDIYHSQLITVGKPRAGTSYSTTDQESYWRYIKDYKTFAETLKNRKEVIYVGSNSGILHAIDAESGVEKWGFVPPFVASRLPRLMNTNLNETTPTAKGGSNAIYGVDGNPVQHDIFFESPLGTGEAWHTILFVPYGRGGSGFSVLDVTSPDDPLHLLSIYNDTVNNKVYKMDHDENITFYEYISRSYPLSEFKEAINAGDNYMPDKNAEVAAKQKCDATGTTYCYKSTKWTLEVANLKKQDITVFEEGKDITSTINITYDASGNTEINFSKEMQYDADESTGNKTNSPIGLVIKSGTVGTGVTTDPQWDYSGLGETWSDPRIFRLPNDGPGDANRLDDITVAVMGGGFGAQFSGAGSNVFVINLQDKNEFGKLEKVINIEDTIDSDIDNSVPSNLVVITSDLAKGANFAGALAYASDLEGKVTKINLTNMSADQNFVPIDLYDSTTLFKVGSSKSNGRYLYKSLTSVIGQTTNHLWLFGGTGDAQRLNDKSTGTDNFLFGIKDPDYPNYREVKTPSKADDITRCKDTSNDKIGTPCRVKDLDRGWYVKLPNFAKLSAKPTADNGLVYFPVYRPSNKPNKCELGDALACTVDDECGTHDSFLGLETSRNEQTGTVCRFVGKGVLSEFIIYAGKIFANISGKSIAGAITDTIQLDKATGETLTYRKSWREN